MAAYRHRRYPRRVIRRGRRGSRGAWLPVLGTTWSSEGFTFNDLSFSGGTGPVQDNRGQGPQQNVFPVTKDFSQFVTTSTQLSGPSLRDITEGQTWRLNRIVGQLHVDVQESNDQVGNTTWPKVQIAAGFFVARQADSDPTLPDLTFDEIDPLNVNNAQNSWIWRRSWILSRPLASNVGFAQVPGSNCWLPEGSGPFIDSKVKRNVLKEHRLWFVLGAIGWDGTSVEYNPASGFLQPYVDFNLDIRLHGQMIRAKNSPTF